MNILTVMPQKVENGSSDLLKCMYPTRTLPVVLTLTGGEGRREEERREGKEGRRIYII